MIFKQFYLESLGHASYLLGSEETGEALVLDPRRDVDVYLDAARTHGLRLRYAVDTHQHNDYATGSLELAHRTNARIMTGKNAPVRYDAIRAADGEALEIGEVLIQILETLGPTPEHISLLVTDRSRGEAPVLLLSGGALLVGDVARPDLIGGREQAERHASELCGMLQQKILPLDDHIEVYPTHVSGSLCAGHISSKLSTTIGYERRMNRMLTGLTSKGEFVQRCVDLKTLPAVPPYWRRLRVLNTEGPPLLGALPEVPPLPPDEVEQLRRQGLVVLDCRSPEAFGGAHIPGSLNAGLEPMFPTWTGTVLPLETSYLVVVEQERDLQTVIWDLLRVGFDLPKGWLAGGMKAWRTVGLPIQTIPQWTVWELRDGLKNDPQLLVLDVRQPAEWKAGHINGAIHITGAELPHRVDEVPRGRPMAVICSSGYRSSAAASLLTSSTSWAG